MIRKQFLFRLIVAMWLVTMSSMAQSAESEDRDDFSWNVTLGVGLISDPTLLAGAEQYKTRHYWGVLASLDLYYKGFFIQTNKHRTNGFLRGSELGYELYIADDYEFDLISKSYLVGFDENNAGLVQDEKIPELEGIRSREFSADQGIRYIRYLNDAVYWIDIAGNILNDYHDGWVLDAFYSHIIPIRNWDINIGAGATYFSSEMNNFYFSITEEEANESRPIYEAGAGYRLELEAIAQYPISEDWLFSSGLTFSHYSNSIADSPIVARQNVLRFQVGVSYVF